MPLQASWSDPVESRQDYSLQQLSDQEVIERVKRGDQELFELILRRYNQRLYRVARSIIGEDAEAEDVVQETYLRAYQNLHQFEGRSSFSTWLTKIAVHEASARRRKRNRLQIVDLGNPEIDKMVDLSKQFHSSEDTVSQRELRRLIEKAVDQLPSDLRVVFGLRMVEQLGTVETAKCLAITQANVRVRLHRARLQLRSWIDHHLGEEYRKLFMFDGERCDRIVESVMSRLS